MLLYVDLLTIDISDLNNVKEVYRDENAFPYVIPEYDGGLLEAVDYDKGVITGYRMEQRTEKVTDDDGQYWHYPTWEGRFLNFDGVNTAKINTAGSGTGGSMARFTLYDDYLYIIDMASLHLFNVSNNENPTLDKKIPISWQIETLFPYEEKLFIGARSGMYIYSLQNPAQPEFLSEFRHVTACDPVVVEGDYAYVTLKGGNLCGTVESQLDVIDISILFVG